ERTDIFALGAILYECLSGQRAFDAPTLAGIVFRVCYEQPTPLRELQRLPAALDHVIARALAKTRSDRYASIAALRRDVEAACSADDSEAVAYAATQDLAADGHPTPAANLSTAVAKPGRRARFRYLPHLTAALFGAGLLAIIIWVGTHPESVLRKPPPAVAPGSQPPIAAQHPALVAPAGGGDV